MVDARVTVRKPNLQPGVELAGKRIETLHGTDQYIDMPTVGEQKPIIEVMDSCIDVVEKLLANLKLAGY